MGTADVKRPRPFCTQCSCMLGDGDCPMCLVSLKGVAKGIPCGLCCRDSDVYEYVDLVQCWSAGCTNYSGSLSVADWIEAYGPKECAEGDVPTVDPTKLTVNEIKNQSADLGTILNLTTDPKAAVRKGRPVCTGVLDYFPDAILAVAECSRLGNEQHNPGTPLHWDRTKSQDESDALMRHLMERGSIDDDGVRHSTKVAWRALALLQKEIEEAR